MNAAAPGPRSGLVSLLLVAALTLFGALRAAFSGDVPGDFLRYHRAGRLVATGLAERLYDDAYLEGRHVYAEERRATGEKLPEDEFKYAPALAVLVAPLGVLPAREASVLWGAWNGFLAGAMLVAVWRWCGAGASPWWMLVPLAILARAVNDNLNLGQVNPSAIVPATLGLVWLARGRDVAAGALVAAGAAVKYMPGVLAAWLAWKRRWRALAAFAVVAAGAFVGLPALVLGPARATALTREWLDTRMHVYTSHSREDVPGYSVKSFVYRVFGGVPYRTRGDNGPGEIDAGVAHAPGETLQVVVLALDALLLVAVLAATRGPLRTADDPRGPPEAGLALGVLLLVSPESRAPHFLYLALAVAALTYALVRTRGRPRTALVLGIAGAVLLNATSKSLPGPALADALAAVCAPGWGALAVLVALYLAARKEPA